MRVAVIDYKAGNLTSVLKALRHLGADPEVTDADRALGDKRGILRAGYFLMPMDETLAIAAVDLSGRAAFAVDTKVRTRLVGDLQTELVTDFFEGFARGARANVHVKTMYGRSNHHKIEAIFKAFARALRVACSRDKQLGEMLPSTKGLL